MKNIEETLQLLRLLKDQYGGDSGKNRAGRVRYHQLVDVGKNLKDSGFPQCDEEKFRYSFVPLIFQEANYDDLDWTKLGSDLGQLQPFFNLDFVIQNDGKELTESNENEYHNYVRKSLAAIDCWKKRHQDYLAP